MNLKIALVANSVISAQSMGGGDRILVELAKRWQQLGAQLTLFGPPESNAVCEAAGLRVNFVETSNYDVKILGTVRTYLGRMIKAIQSRTRFGSFDIIYSASETMPDVILSSKIKRQNPQTIWIIGFYLVAPNPFWGEASLNISNILQFFQQKFSLVLSGVFKASAFFVLGRDDRDYLKRWGFSHILRIGGGVDLDLVNSVSDQEKIYDACFVGRISKQKGVDDLLKIWRMVVDQKPLARLAFIGWGHPGQKEMFIGKIKEIGLDKNISFLGFVDGAEKYRVMKSSKILLFPSHYESFGIVVLEALAAGLPVVAYDLEVLRENFDGAVFFVPCGNTNIFVQRVLDLLRNNLEIKDPVSLGQTIVARFDWAKLGSDTFNYINEISNQ